MEENKEKNPLQDDEIDLIELFKVVWSARLFIIKVTSVFIVFGLIIALTGKVEYEASCKLMPENQEGIKSNLGGLGGLAGLAGINLNLGTTGSLSPQLYPQIAKSVPFQLELLETPVYFKKLDSTITSYHYFSEIDKPSLVGYFTEYTINLPGKIKKLFKSKDQSLKPDDKDLLVLTKDEWDLVENFQERFSISVDVETGIISIKTEMPDAFVAASLTNKVVKELTKRITDYKIEKVKLNLNFIQERYEESKKEYEFQQRKLALFTDQNRNITSSIIEAEYQRLQNDLNISFEVYKGLASQLEQAKIKVKEETPVFTVLEPVKVPVEKSKPRRGLILALSTLFGILSSSIYKIVTRNNFSNIE